MATAVKQSLWKRAFFNQYNYILLASTALFTAATGSWLPAVVGVGAEILWMVLGVDTKGFRRWVAAQDAKESQKRLEQERTEMLYGLDDRYVQRYDALRGMVTEIRQLAAENQGLETSLIQDEMAKLDQLLDSFLRMATAHQRLAIYLQQNPGAQVEREIAQDQRLLRSETDPRVQSSLKQAISLGQKRLAKHGQIEGAWKSLSVQIDTLEKSFDYLKSHILGIGTREELAAALDDLVAGVASVSELEATTDDLHDELKAAAAARAAASVGGSK
jgi:hypothetical protein